MARLATAVLEVQPLVLALGGRVRVVPPPDASAVLDAVCDRLGVARFGSGTAPTALERVVGDRLWQGADVAPPRLAPAALDAVVDRVAAADFDRRGEWVTVRGEDGVPVRAYVAGHPAAPPLLVVSACGMPARLTRHWVDRLRGRFRVVVGESRALFPPTAGTDPDAGVDAQVRDLVAVADHLGVTGAHVVGLCGGAVVAVVAAHRHPELVASMSLWHGDFELGSAAAKTDHQRDLLGMMQMAARSRAGAAAVHGVIGTTMRTGSPPDLAHLVLYPYATPELLYHYCRLNGAIMTTDVRPLLAGVRQPTLVVTSASDRTAHPDGSRYVAGELPTARLVVSERGDHLSLFRDVPRLDPLLLFLAGTGPGSADGPAAHD